jgi:hypothetical protein
MKSMILGVLTGCLSLAQATDKCRALAFSSGDEDAAYQAGVMKGITTSPNLTAEDW